MYSIIGQNLTTCTLYRVQLFGEWRSMHSHAVRDLGINHGCSVGMWEGDRFVEIDLKTMTEIK